MFKLISRIIQSKGFAIFVKVMASLASTIVVVNGYLILLNRKAQDDPDSEEIEENSEEATATSGGVAARVSESIAEEDAPELPEDDINQEGKKKRGSIHLFRRRK